MYFIPLHGFTISQRKYTKPIFKKVVQERLKSPKERNLSFKYEGLGLFFCNTIKTILCKNTGSPVHIRCPIFYQYGTVLRNLEKNKIIPVAK